VGASHYVTLSTAEYAALQRIVGIARCTVKNLPTTYATETATLRVALDAYYMRFGTSNRG
jgi:hypothetical protein